MILDEGVLHLDSFAKYAAAFFSMSRSSVTRINSDLRRRFSRAKLSSSWKTDSGLEYCFIQSYKDFVLTPSLFETSRAE